MFKKNVDNIIIYVFLTSKTISTSSSQSPLFWSPLITPSSRYSSSSRRLDDMWRTDDDDDEDNNRDLHSFLDSDSSNFGYGHDDSDDLDDI